MRPWAVTTRPAPARRVGSSLSRAVVHLLVVVGGDARRPRPRAETAVREYRRAGRALVAQYEAEAERVIRGLQAIPLTKTRREDALRLVEYMPRLTAAGHRRQAAKHIWEMRRRYGSVEARRRLRALAAHGRLENQR